MHAPPLTHHEILGLVEPFARAGLRVDLSASERAQRRLVFKPSVPTDAPEHAGACHETLQLESLGTGTSRLTLTRTAANGQQATVVGLGTDLASLIAQVRGVPAERQFWQGPGWAMARSYHVGTPEGAPVLTAGEVRVDGLALRLTVSMVRGVAGEVQLTAAPGAALDLPQDLLAVMGWNWARLLTVAGGGWKSKLRLKGPTRARTARAEAALDRAAEHLARTLAETPAQYHRRLLGARWGVFLRRGIPTLNVLVLLAVVLLMPRLDMQVGTGLWMLLYHVPTVLIALSFCLQELPQFEIPPVPRRPRSTSWRVAAV